MGSAVKVKHPASQPQRPLLLLHHMERAVFPASDAMLASEANCVLRNHCASTKSRV